MSRWPALSPGSATQVVARVIVAVQALHLVVGLAAVGLVENLTRTSRRREEVTG